MLHDHGVVTAWARAAGPGAVVGLNLPTGMYDAPADLAWQVLVADCAALPALARVLEQTPPAVRNRVVVEVPGDEHRIDLPAHPRHRGHLGPRRQRRTGPAGWRRSSASLPHPDAPGGYVWVAGESRALRGVRRYLRRELGLPASRYKAVGYWIERAEEWNQRYDALDEVTRRFARGDLERGPPRGGHRERVRRAAHRPGPVTPHGVAGPTQ